MNKIRFLLAALGVVSLSILSAGTAAAHHITDAYALCEQNVIVVEYADFGKKDWPAFLDGPGEYEITDITGEKTGSLTFPLFQGTSGGTGHYTFKWQHGTYGFDVECDEPEVTPTPTPEPTPTPTPTPTPEVTPTPEIPCDAEIFDGENPNCPTDSPDVTPPAPTGPPTDLDGTTILGPTTGELLAPIIILIVASTVFLMTLARFPARKR